MTKLIFSCIATVSETCFTSVLHESVSCEQVFQPRMIALHTKIPLHFLVLPQKQHFCCPPHKFSIGLRSGDWAGGSIMLVLLVWDQDAAGLLVCLGLLSC